MAAESLLKKILEEAPGNEAALVELAMINILDKNDPDGALPYIKRAIAANSENEAMISELLGIMDEKGQASDAVLFLTNLADETDSNPSLDYGIAQAMIKTGESEKALEYLERSVGEREGFQRDDILEQMGDLYYETGKIDLAMESWGKTLERQAEYLASHPEDLDILAEQNLDLRFKYLSGQIEMGDAASLDAADSELANIEKLAPGNALVGALREALRERRADL